MSDRPTVIAFPLSDLLRGIECGDPHSLCDLHRRAWFIACGIIDAIPDWEAARTLDNYDIGQPDLLENLLVGLTEVVRACRLAGMPVV